MCFLCERRRWISIILFIGMLLYSLKEAMIPKWEEIVKSTPLNQAFIIQKHTQGKGSLSFLNNREQR